MEFELGKVMHYYTHIHVAVLMLKGMLKTGDKIHIHGHQTDVVQRVGSMEIDHLSVLWAQPGDHVAIRVSAPVREHDVLYRVVEGVLDPQFA